MSSIARPSCPISSALWAPVRGVEVAPADQARGAGHPSDRREDDAPQEHDDARGHPEDRQPGDHDLTVAGPGHLLVERLQPEADADHAADSVVGLVALLTGFLVPERSEEGQDAPPADHLGELLRLDGLHGPLEERMVEALARRALEARDAADQLGLEADVAVDRLDGLEVGEGLDPVAAVDVDPAHVPELGAELVEEPADDVGAALHHPVLDGGQDGGREEPGGLAVPLLEGLPLPPEVEREEQAEPEEQDADDERQDLGAELLAQEPPGLHVVPARPPPVAAPRIASGPPGVGAARAIQTSGPGHRPSIQ